MGVMIDFFKPSDFGTNLYIQIKDAVAISNSKLEREGRVVYGAETEYSLPWSHINLQGTKYQALLIGIQPIIKCDHPKEKVHYTPYESFHLCKCGAKVEPSSFMEVK